jgi:hypothetical protein
MGIISLLILLALYRLFIGRRRHRSGTTYR